VLLSLGFSTAVFSGNVFNMEMAARFKVKDHEKNILKF
jgi:hypothetical protein